LNCGECQTGVFEQIGYVIFYKDGTIDFVLDRFKCEKPVVYLLICSHCGEVKLLSGDNTLSFLKKLMRQNENDPMNLFTLKTT